jgi:hypothetical protein
MDNPYQAPTANVDTGIVEPPSKKGWKIFSWFLLSMQLLSVFFVMLLNTEEYESEMTNLDNISMLLVYPAIIIGVFAYAYNWKLLSPIYWKLLIVVGVMMDIYSAYLQDFSIEDLELLGVIGYLFVGVIVFLLLVMAFLQYFALYQYAFKSPEIWIPQDNNES